MSFIIEILKTVAERKNCKAVLYDGRWAESLDGKETLNRAYAIRDIGSILPMESFGIRTDTQTDFSECTNLCHSVDPDAKLNAATSPNPIGCKTNRLLRGLCGYCSLGTPFPDQREYFMKQLESVVSSSEYIFEGDMVLVERVCLENISIREGPLAGLSLEILRRLRPMINNMEEGYLSETALLMAGDPSYSDSSRTTALLVMEQEHHPRTHEVAQTILHESGIGPILRQTARAVAER